MAFLPGPADDRMIAGHFDHRVSDSLNVLARVHRHEELDTDETEKQKGADSAHDRQPTACTDEPLRLLKHSLLPEIFVTGFDA
jgi:hypothetical protein